LTGDSKHGHSIGAFLAHQYRELLDRAVYPMSAYAFACFVDDVAAFVHANRATECELEKLFASDPMRWLHVSAFVGALTERAEDDLEALRTIRNAMILDMEARSGRRITM
jgi:hypothetical protein